MTRFGDFLSGREYGPAGLVRQAPSVAQAGFDEAYIGQAGGGHEGFFDFYANAVLPRLRER